MKKLLILTIAVFAFSCKQKEAEPFGKETNSEKTESVSEGIPAETQSPEQLGETIYNGKGNCAACHKANEKLIGPSLHDIAKIYKEQNGDMVAFLKGESEAIVDPSQFAVMQANITLTKTFTDEELQGLEAYINSNLK